MISKSVVFMSGCFTTNSDKGRHYLWLPSTVMRMNCEHIGSIAAVLPTAGWAELPP
jgi:hypothetical protein